MSETRAARWVMIPSPNPETGGVFHLIDHVRKTTYPIEAHEAVDLQRKPFPMGLDASLRKHIGESEIVPGVFSEAELSSIRETLLSFKP